jgi:hypothetical protein
MSSALELHDSRVSHISVIDGVAKIFFSCAYVHKSTGRPGADAGSVWTQEAELVLERATLVTPLPALPNTIAAGFLEVGGVQHELIPLPFKRKVAATLRLTFSDASEIEITGHQPVLELFGQPIYLEDYS